MSETKPQGAPGDTTIERRKAEHIERAQGDVEARRPAGWNDVHLVHQALPELDLSEVGLATSFLGHRAGAPFVIASMTGGHRQGTEINRRLARAARDFGLMMGLGSQRAALRDPALASTYAVVRDEAPDAFMIANIGAAQLIAQGASEPALTIDDVRRACEMIGANAIAIHLNFLEETIQPEGDSCSRGCLSAIERIVDALAGEVPVIAKETGAGLAPETARRLVAAGVSALDVGGVGGTSFAAIEGERAAARGDSVRAALGDHFRDWGLPTAVSVIAAAETSVPVIATGGIRSGLDAAKAIALGAGMVGLGRPMLQAALAGDEALRKRIEGFLTELRTAMFLSGTADVAGLQAVGSIVIGETAEWVSQLGSEPADAGYQPRPRATRLRALR